MPAVSFASSAIRRPDEDGSRRTFRVFMSLIAAAESSDSAPFAAAASVAINDICSSLADAFLSCGTRHRAQLDVINMALEMAHALSTHQRVAAALPASVAGSLRDTFVSALTVPSKHSASGMIAETRSNFSAAGTSGMALSAASGISLLVTSRIIAHGAASDAFTMLCDLAVDAKAACSQTAATNSDDDAVPLHLHACRLIAACISSISTPGSTDSGDQFENICKSRVIPVVSAQLSAALRAPDSPFPSAVIDDDAEASNPLSRHLSPTVACITALCRCSSLVPAVVASFMPDLIRHLKVAAAVMISRVNCNNSSVQGAAATELLIGMEAASGSDAEVAAGLFADMVLPCSRALTLSRRRESCGEEAVCPAIVALASLAAKCMRMARDQLASLTALYASLEIDSSFFELPPDDCALIVTSCIVSLAPSVHGSLPILNLCILLANSSMLLAPPGPQSLCAGAGAALGSLVNKCEASVAASAAAAAFDVLHHRVTTQRQSDAAAQSLAWIVRFVSKSIRKGCVACNAGQGTYGTWSCLCGGV